MNATLPEPKNNQGRESDDKLTLYRCRDCKDTFTEDICLGCACALCVNCQRAGCCRRCWPGENYEGN